MVSVAKDERTAWHGTEYAAIQRAYQLGYDIAHALKPGDLFTGAYGAADDTGYTDKIAPRLRGVFVTGYLFGLNARSITTTRDNVIIRIERKG